MDSSGLGEEKMAGCCKICNDISFSTNMRIFSGLAVEILASQEGYCSVQLFS